MIDDKGEYSHALSASAPNTSDRGAVNSVEREKALVLGPVVNIGKPHYSDCNKAHPSRASSSSHPMDL